MAGGRHDRGLAGDNSDRSADRDGERSPATNEQRAAGARDTYAATADYQAEDVPISREQFDEILATEKGQRPPPESYLPPEYIAEHLSHFQSGASRIMLRSDYDDYGIGKPDDGKSEFVLTRNDAEAMLEETGGDPVKLGQRLGIPQDQLADDSIVVIEFQPTGSYRAHMPSGNEWGANKQWLPGGRLPAGDLEAVVHTDGMISGRDYTVKDLKTGEML